MVKASLMSFDIKLRKRGPENYNIRMTKHDAADMLLKRCIIKSKGSNQKNSITSDALGPLNPTAFCNVMELQ